MKIGITELMVIFIVALLVIGPDRLPAYAQKLGQAMAQFKKYSSEATRDIKESIVEPLEEAQAPLREAIAPLEDLDRSVRSDVKDLQTSFKDIGRMKKTGASPASPPPAAEPQQEPAMQMDEQMDEKEENV